MELKDFGFREVDHARLKAINKPYKIYATLIDEETQKQFEDVLKAPFVTYGALMPDAHAGYTMPIGGVCATDGVIVPQFVGFDIGCGVCAYATDYFKDDVAKVSEEIYRGIVERVPLGFNSFKNHQSFKSDLPITDFAKLILNQSGLKQLGTLGGGNHFIEVGFGRDERVWVVIHSGSRGFGHKIASHYMLQAYLEQNPAEEKLSRVVKDWEERNVKFKEANLEAYNKALKKYINKQSLKIAQSSRLDNIKGIWGLRLDSDLGKSYEIDQNFALNFALENRKRMITAVVDALNSALKGDFEIDFDDSQRFINRNHNHAEFDEDLNLWIHRKGATHAKKGMLGVIPGNMRDGSFVVRGKGAKESLFSSSHGAGRVMSRRKAQSSVTLEQFKESMSGIYGTVDENTIDESPFAYKDIFEVMELQSDLIDVVEHIRPIINVKDNSSRRGKRRGR